MLNKLNVKRYINDETGVSLLIAVMTLLVLSIIGVTLATVTFANVKLTTTDREYQSAYYIAEAGVNETYADIRDTVRESYEKEDGDLAFFNTIETAILGENELNTFETSFGKDPMAEITVTKIDEGNPRTYQISSKGSIGQRERTVTKEFVVNWVAKGGRIDIPTATAVVKNNVILNNSGSIDGDVYLTSDSSGTIKITGAGGNRISGVAYVPDGAVVRAPINENNTKKPNVQPHNSELLDWGIFETINSSFPTFDQYNIFPDVSIYKDSHYRVIIENGNFSDASYALNDYVLELEDHYSFNKMEFYNNRTLRIDSQSEVINIVVKDFDLKNGHLEFLSDVKINLFVLDSLSIKSGSTINRNENSENFSLFYLGEKPLDIMQNVKLHGLFYAPFSDVILGNGAEIFGSIIAKSLKLEGNGQLRHRDVSNDFSGSSPNNPNDQGNLLTPKPNTE